ELERITCAVYAVGGWADAYTNAIPRLLAGLTAPRKGLIGPWAHVYPHTGGPGAAIGFLQEALRWWDRWLKGIDTGVLDEPLCRIWMQESPDGAGRWVAEATWPSPRITPKRHALAPGRLEEAGGPEVPVEWRSPPSVGLAAGDWCCFGGEDAPTDQRDDDAGSLTFDSAPLGERLEILGAPVAVLALAVDRPQAFLAVRLNEILPDGSSVRVTYGVLNLTHRASHEHPEAIEPGRRYRVRVALNHIAHAFGAGGQGRIEEIDLELEQSSVRRYRIQERDPLTARAEVVHRMGLRRGTWAVTVESHAWFSATEEAFELRARLEAFEGDTLLRSRT